MKKVLILSIILLLCVGCTRIDNREDYDTVVDTVINSGMKKANTASLGYKYYLPLGVSKVYDKDYNQKFKIDNMYMYLYVDAVSYYYQNDLNLNENNDGHYYKQISNDNKKGYIKITEEDNDKYLVKIVYNYSKIETYTPKIKIDKVLTNSMIILNSIDYNEKLIKKQVEDDFLTSVDKEYQIKKPKDAKSKFSEYLSEYVQEEEKVEPDLPEY